MSSCGASFSSLAQHTLSFPLPSGKRTEQAVWTALGEGLAGSSTSSKSLCPSLYYHHSVHSGLLKLTVTAVLFTSPWKRKYSASPHISCRQLGNAGIGRGETVPIRLIFLQVEFKVSVSLLDMYLGSGFFDL